jgi:hypothetical protein
MRHSNVNKRGFKIDCKSPETLTNKEKHRTSNIAGAIQALTMAFKVRSLCETIAMELDFSGKDSFHDLALLRTKY